MRKAIVLSYHGTREKEKSQKIYDRVQEYFSGKFPEFKIMVTIDSEFVIKKLGEDGEIRLQSTDKALEELYLIGCEKVYIQPMYLLQGKILREREEKNMEYRMKFKEMKNLLPVLGTIAQIKEFTEVLISKFNSSSGIYLFVGHGGTDIGNCALGMIGYLLSLKRDNCFVITLEEGIELDILLELFERKNPDKIFLIPLFAQSGIHFNEDIKKIVSKLEERERKVELREKTLFEYNEILEILVRRLKEEIEKIE